jgi:DNA invertase Pin-like site-specific DNA recombinase
MSGCAVCVYDLHEEALKAYKEAVLSLQNSLSALHIPMDEWPSSIRQQGSSELSGQDKRKEMVLNAFEEMERTLKLKRQSEAEAQARS